MSENNKDELFTAQKVSKEPIQLVQSFNSPEEEQAALEEAMKVADAQIKYIKENRVKGEDGTVQVPLVTSDKKDGSEKKYLLLFSGYEKDTELEFREWEEAKGRKSAYEIIVGYMEDKQYAIDLVESKILVDVERYEQAKTIYDFLNWIIKNDMMPEYAPYPHLDEYMVGDYEEVDENGEQ